MDKVCCWRSFHKDQSICQNCKCHNCYYAMRGCQNHKTHISMSCIDANCQRAKCNCKIFRESGD